jgi:hypothetical protein
MSLSNLWLTSENELNIKSINQIMSIAGDGKLLDDSETSKELRSFYRIIPSANIESYISQCLENKFESSGLVLQDLINEIGIRLEFKVMHGRYRGVSGKIGFDGIWETKNNQKVIIEVKTTDTYRIDLNVLANYRKEYLKLESNNEEDISILIVVGRQDTGDLESQVRGSKYSWNIRIISTDALIKMLNIKENINDPKTLDRVHEIIIPREYTRLDSIIDMLFSTTEEIIENNIIDNAQEEDDDTKKEKKFTPVSYRNKCIERYKNLKKINLIKRSYGLFETEDQKNGLLCAISREYEKNGRKGYWFAIHPHQIDFLKEHEGKSVIFACGSENIMINVPFDLINDNIDKLNQTVLEDGRFYWHIHIHLRNMKYMWIMKKEFEDIDISQYII